MLRELYIKNYALIDELTLQFSESLTVLSGETGAGKSIIVGALSLILGEKARTSSIRSGTESCTVEGRFEVMSGHPAYGFLSSRGIEDGSSIVIRRVIARSGSSKCFVNGLQVSVRDLQSLTGILIDIHGQHQHQSLLNVKNHLPLLDRYGKLEKELQHYKQSYKRLQDIEKKIKELTLDEREKERRIDILKHSLQEIDDGNLHEGEEEELSQEYGVLKNYEQLVSAAATTHSYLRKGESSALTMIERSIDELMRVQELSPEIGKILNELDAAKIVVQESSHTLQDFVDGIEYEPGKIDRILSRLEQIKALKRKYGDSIGEIQAYRAACEEELSSLESNEQVLGELEEQKLGELREARKRAVTLSAQRRVAAKTMEERVMKELDFLSMRKSVYRVNISYSERADGAVQLDGKNFELLPNGLDLVEFLISTNVGEPLLPLKNVASGGELSRIMLAIKTVLGNVDPIRTFVFDEIDAGIGGRVAWAVGSRLKELSGVKQILCITHQPQIASRGNLNLRVDKISRNGRAVTAVEKLDGIAKVEEIARMISGKTVTEAALKQAHQMIKEA
jgi:DNA repair protein RecN (Recombination protein N)